MKVILTIDTQNNLIDSEDLERYSVDIKICDKYEDEYILSKYNLPLKPMPKKYELTTEKGNRYAVGYNDCIDDILGGKNEF